MDTMTDTVVSTYADLLRIGKVASLYVSTSAMRQQLQYASLSTTDALARLVISATDSYQAVVIKTNIIIVSPAARAIIATEGGVGLRPKQFLDALAAHKATSKSVDTEISVKFHENGLVLTSEVALTNVRLEKLNGTIPDYAALLPKEGSLSTNDTLINPEMLDTIAEACRAWNGKNGLPITLHYAAPGKPAHWSLATDKGSVTGLFMPSKG